MRRRHRMVTYRGRVTETRYEWRGDFANHEVNAIHAEAFEHRLIDDDWRSITERHSLGWVTAREGDALVGFANVVWDGTVHAWLQDVMVASAARRRGIGLAMIGLATERAKAGGCEWLHVDFDNDLRPFYFDAAGFVPTNGGLIDLTRVD